MKNLILAIMLMTIGIALPIEASAKIDPIRMEKQRAINKANTEKIMRLRSGKKERRLFNKAEATTKERTLKLDAIPPSPRRTAKTASKSSKSTTKPEHSPEAAKAPKE